MGLEYVKKIMPFWKENIKIKFYKDDNICSVFCISPPFKIAEETIRVSSDVYREYQTVKGTHVPSAPFSLWLHKKHCTKSRSDVAEIEKLS
jgi:hypothetical protein